MGFLMCLRLCILVAILFTISTAYSQVSIDGYVYLENQTDHSGIAIAFDMTAPSTASYAAITDSQGYYVVQVDAGIYDIEYSKIGYNSIMYNESLYITITLQESTLSLHNTIISVPHDFASIQEAISSEYTYSGDTIIVDPGIYHENINFIGKAITVGSQFLLTGSLEYIEETIIDAEGSGAVVSFVDHENNNSIISGFTIRNGYNSSGDARGGGIKCYNGASPSLEYLIISGNQASSGGGIGCDVNCSPSISNVTIIGNTAGYAGGGIYCSWYSSPTLENVIIADNISSDGGGIYCRENSSPSVVHSTITGNVVSNNDLRGGGISTYSGSAPEIVNTIISNHSNHYGIFDYSGGVQISYSNMFNNDTGDSYGSNYVGINVTVNSNGDSCDAYYNIRENPYYIDSSTHNFSLSDWSQLIGAGTTTNIPATDIEDNPRPNPAGSNPDIGAYENPSGIPQRMPVTINVPGDYSTIQAGLNAADSTDTVLVQPGTYYENIIWPETNGITLVSAGDSSNTIIDGGGVSSVIYINPQTVTIGTTTIIRGFQIKNGGNVNNGGGIICINASPLLASLIISENTAADGAGVYANTSNLQIANTTINGNSATHSGGGIFLTNLSSPLLVNVTISQNSAVYEGGGLHSSNLCSPQLSEVIIIGNSADESHGGGIYLSSSPNDTIRLYNVTVRENVAWMGGGAHINTSIAMLIDVVIDANVASRTPNGKAGGLSGNYSDLILERVIISDNSLSGSNSDGGGFYSYFCTNNFNDVTIIGNSASRYGGGISETGSETTNSTYNKVTLMHNTALDGAGMNISGAAPILSNMTIVDNVATGQGGGLYVWAEAAPSLTSVNIINNLAQNGAGIYINYNAHPSLNNVNIINNMANGDGDGIYVASGNPTISYSNISNKGFGVYSVDNSLIVAATNNYWGDESGPFHLSQNINGLGDSTNAFVNVSPWLTTPNTDAPPIPAQNVALAGTGNDFINLEWDPSPLGDFAGFKLNYDTDESGYPYENSVDIGSNTSYALSGLDLGTEYFLAVTVYDTDGNESWYSNEVTGVTRVIEAQNLDIAGDEDLQHLITHNPFITFDYFDSMGETQTNYQAQISTDSTFQSNLIWDSGEVTSDANSIQYTGGALQNGVKYYLRARVASGSFWSNWTNLAFGMNTEPSIPTQLSLIDDEVTTSDVILEISNSMDAEGDNLSYDFRLYDKTQTVQLDSAIGVAQDIDATVWEVITALDDNAQHWWTVRAYDGYEYSELAGPASFLINLENDTPADFNLTSPLAGEAITSQSPLFTWDPAADPDPLDTVRYVLYLDTPDPGIETFEVETDTSFQLIEVLEDNTSYHWKVVARDLAGATTTSAGGYQSFTVNTSNDLPAAFTLLSPDNNAMVTTLTPEFLWEASSDPDDETIVMRGSGKGRKAIQSSLGDNSVMVITGYDFYLGTDAQLTGATPVEVIGTSYTPETDLIENQVYYWIVSALDDSGGVTFSDTASFWTNSYNEVPSAFELISPADSSTFVDDFFHPTFAWHPAYDPDLYDSLEYRLTWRVDNHIVGYQGTDTSWTPSYDFSQNTIYQWWVEAIDASGAVTMNTNGVHTFIMNYVNDDPWPARLLSPDSVVVLTDTPTFIWERSFDPDPFELVNYEVHWWYEGSEWDSILTEETSVRISNPLTEDNKQYFWQVISMDDEGGIAQSQDFMFWVDFLPEPPGTFALLGPEDESTGNSTRPELTWEPSMDPDPFDHVSYQIAISTDSNMVDIVYEGAALPESHIPDIELQIDSRYYWQVSAMDEDSLQTLSDVWTFDVGYVAIDDGLALPTEYVLDQNYPNPFNPSTTIRYGLPEDSNVSLVIYDVRGQVVQTLESDHQSAGWYDVVWNGETADGKSISTGIYFARLVAGDFSQVIKMLYLK